MYAKQKQTNILWKIQYKKSKFKIIALVLCSQY